MKDGRIGGVALVAGALGFLVTMALHPTGHDLVEPGAFERGALLAGWVHALAIASLPISFLGLSALARRAGGGAGTAELALVAWKAPIP